MDIDQEIKKMTNRAIARFSSLDETISTIRDEHATEMQEARDARVAAEIEAELCKKLLAEANLERDSYMRVAVKLISQFSMVEAVFADAKKLAIEYAAAQPQPPAAYELKPEAEAAPAHIGTLVGSEAEAMAERLKRHEAQTNYSESSEPKDGTP